MAKKINLNELNKLAGGNCKSFGEMLKKVAEKDGTKETINGIHRTKLSDEVNKKLKELLQIG